MACNRVRLADISKYRKKYPHVRNLPKTIYVTDRAPEIENIIADVPILADTVEITFDSPFSGIPSVVANYISLGDSGNVNVYVVNISTTGVTVRTSAPVVGKIAIHAVYIEGCPTVAVSPYVVLPPVLDPAIVGDTVACSAGSFGGISSPSITYTLYIGGLPVPGYTGTSLASILGYTYTIGDAGQSVYVQATAVNPSGTVSVNSNVETVVVLSMPFVIYVDTTIQTPVYSVPFITSPSATNEYRFMGIGQFDIDWGDGNIDYGVTGVPGVGLTHVYATSGQYEISVSNWTDTGNGIAFQTYTPPSPFPVIDGDCVKLLEIRAWGTIGWTSMLGAFAVCENMIGTFTDVPDLSACTSLSLMFAACTSFNTSIDSWNVSSITDTSGMFIDAALYDQPMNSWNVSNVTTMESMFTSQQVPILFNQPLNLWNVRNVSNMDYMFYFAVAFDQDLGSWNLNNSVSMNFMLSNCNMSTENYSRTLIGWANYVSSVIPASPGPAKSADVPAGVTLGAAGLSYNNTNYLSPGPTYTDAYSARAYLINSPIGPGAPDWSISGDIAV